MRKTNNPKLILMLASIIGIFVFAEFAIAEDSLGSLQEINKAFPNSIQVRMNAERSVEFCPDNTCDLFVAKKELSIEGLRDFAYLFIYYFSDFYVLEDWRKKNEAKQQVKTILSKPLYQDCRSDREEDSARCLLLKISEADQIQVFSVRYDEKIRNIVPMDIKKALSISRGQK